MNIIELNNQIEKFVQKNDLSMDALALKKENAISNSAEWQAVLDEFAEDGRILRIGIIGRVKAGKSSLLNALLFNGQDILPKAATPMTAALTVMEYSEKMRAEIEFFTQEDIDDIRKKHDSYLQIFEEKVSKEIAERKERALRKKNKSGINLEENEDAIIKVDKIRLNSEEPAESENKAKLAVEREMKNHPTYASYDQYTRIQKSGKTLADLAKYQTIDANSVDSLMSKLDDFVGSNGQFMPFTKAVKLYIPYEGLKGLQIIDTPGINDPVTSRGLRTEEMLQHCDVVLFVSPSGQFLSNEDTDLLYRITTKEGTQEAYLIASQVDIQLFGSEKGNSIDPNEVVERISNTLTDHARNVLQKQAQQSPGMKVAIEKLSKNRVICSSSVAYTMMQHFDKQDMWDENLEHVWQNLNDDYREIFSRNDTALATLNKLANIDAVHKVLSDVRERKNEILQQRQINFETAKQTALKDYLSGLDSLISARIQQIESADVSELQQKKNAIEQKQSLVEIEVGNVYDDLIDEIIPLRKQMRGVVTCQMNQYKKELRNAQGTKIEEAREYSHTTGWLWWEEDHYKKVNYEVNTVNATAIKSAIKDTKVELKDQLDDIALEFRKNWRKKLYSGILGTLRQVMGDDNIDISLVSRTLRNIIATIPDPNFEIQSEIPVELKKTGKLKEYEADKFIDAAENYKDILRDDIRNSIDSYITSYVNNLKSINLASGLVANLEEDLKTLIEEIENKEASLYKYSKQKKELMQLIKQAAN